MEEKRKFLSIQLTLLKAYLPSIDLIPQLGRLWGKTFRTFLCSYIQFDSSYEFVFMNEAHMWKFLIA